jgi:hypothetical protein
MGAVALVQRNDRWDAALASDIQCAAILLVGLAAAIWIKVYHEASKQAENHCLRTIVAAGSIWISVKAAESLATRVIAV